MASPGTKDEKTATLCGCQPREGGDEHVTL